MLDTNISLRDHEQYSETSNSYISSFDRNRASAIFSAPHKGYDDLTVGGLPASRDWTDAEIAIRTDQFIAYITEIEAAWNDAAEATGLGVYMNTQKLRRDIDNNNLNAVYAFFEDQDLGGRVYTNQLRTAIDAMKEMIQHPLKFILILGALQSGKTGTGLSLQFFGPVYYLLSGGMVKVYPFYLTANQKSHEAQTFSEARRFMAFHGDIEFQYDGRSCKLLDYYEEALASEMISEYPVLPTDLSAVSAKFKRNPSLANYRDQVLDGVKEASLCIQPEDFIMRRSPIRRGRNGTPARFESYIDGLITKGYVPLPIIDESQYGASGSKCVLKATLNTIAEVVDRRREELANQAIEAGAPSDLEFQKRMLSLRAMRGVFLSATPFAESDLENVRLVRQKLPPSYRGFNFFKGLPIDDEVNVLPPDIISFDELGEQVGAPDLKFVDMAIYRKIVNNTITSKEFGDWAKKAHYKNEYFKPLETRIAAYSRLVEKSLRATIRNLARRNGGRAKNGEPLGICLRLINDNAFTQMLISRLNLGRYVEVIEFFATDDALGRSRASDSVKTLLKKRQNPDRPYLIVVTNKARMGDSFPVEVEYFLEFSRKASDYNALLQGLVGRACGANKNSLVALRAENASIMEDYIAEQGRLRSGMKASRHAFGLETGTQDINTTMVKITYDAGDSVFEEFLNRVNREIVERHIEQNVPRLKKKDLPNQYLPLMQIADELGLFEHIENNPHLVSPRATKKDGVRLARVGDVVRSTDRKGKEISLGYAVNRENGWIGVGFRDSDGDRGDRGTVIRRSRTGNEHLSAEGHDSRTDRVRSLTHLEPQINVRKYDPQRPEVSISPKDPRPGDRRAIMVTFPLLREYRFRGETVSRVTVNETHALDPELTADERLERELILMELDEQRSKRAKSAKRSKPSATSARDISSPTSRKEAA